MKKISVHSSRGNYSIYIGNRLLGKTGKILKSLDLQGKILIVTQQKIAAKYLPALRNSLKGKKVAVHMVADGEPAKSEKELFKIYARLCAEGFERRDTIIALGGGVVGDLAGFTAATFLRGIAFVNIPTTLLAQVDSAIGGKTGINLKEGKNLVGAFYPPRAVISDIQTLKTLPERELRASLAEVVKYGVIRDAKLFSFLEKNAAKILKKDPQSLEKIVQASAAIKAGVVSRDEHETKGERMILNFGHTYGHGFEQAGNYKKLLHGEAVSIGMVAASDLAERAGLFSKENFRRLVNLLKKLGLPVSAKSLQLSGPKILKAMHRDKKKKAGRLRFVLPKHIGQTVIQDNLPLAAVKASLRIALS